MPRRTGHGAIRKFVPDQRCVTPWRVIKEWSFKAGEEGMGGACPSDRSLLTDVLVPPFFGRALRHAVAAVHVTKAEAVERSVKCVGERGIANARRTDCVDPSNITAK